MFFNADLTVLLVAEGGKFLFKISLVSAVSVIALVFIYFPFSFYTISPNNQKNLKKFGGFRKNHYFRWRKRNEI